MGVKQISSFRLPGTESQRAYDLLAEHFPAAKGDTDQLVFKARTGTLNDPATKARIEAALKKTAAAKSVAAVQSPFSEGGQITKDGRIGVASIIYDRSTNDITPETLEKVENAAFTARSADLQVEHGGPGAEIVRFTNSQGPSEFIGVLFAAIVLLITFGSLVAAGLPLIATLLALGSTLGIITLLSHVVDTPDFATQLASLIGLGVGIDYSLFVVTRYRAEVRNGLDRDRAVEMAIDTAGRTVLFAAITVVIALLGLLLLGPELHAGRGARSRDRRPRDDVRRPHRHPGADRRIGQLHRRRAARVRRARRLSLLGHPAPAGHPRRALARAAARTRRERKRAEGSGWARWSHAVQRRPWLAASLAVACSSPSHFPRPTCAWAPATPAWIRPARRRARRTT